MLRQKGRFSAFIIRLAIVATALSVAAMIISLALITGFKKGVREKLFSYWGNVHVTLYTPDNTSIITPEPIQEDDGLVSRIKMLPGVEGVSPFAVCPAIINTGGVMEGIQLKGVDEGYDFSGISSASIDYSDTSYSKDIILSETTLNKLNLKAGDKVLLYFLKPGSLPSIRKVRVKGSYHTGMEEIDKSYAICDIRLLQRANGWAASDINGYQVMLDDDRTAEEISSVIFYDYLPRDSRMTTYTMHEMFPAVYDWLGLLDVNARVIIIIMSIVAIINLTVALLILIIEQARLVGILKTLGMQERQMRRIFLYHATLIGGMGIVAGNILAVGLCILQQQTGFLTLPEDTYYMKYVPVELIWWHPLLVSIATLVLCILCMWLPTLYIRRILPARVLQFK